MRWAPWVLVAAALVALGLWVPARIVERQLAASLRPGIEPGGTVEVRAQATLPGVIRGYLARVHIEAHAIRIGELTAQRLVATLSGIEMARTASGDSTIGRVSAGSAVLEFGPPELARFLRSRGVEDPVVTIEPSDLKAEGTVRAGGVGLRVRVRGQFYGAGSDLRFRVTALEVSGMDLPPALGETVLSAVQPAVSLRGLPFPLVIDSVTSEDGRVVVRARVEGAQ